MKIMFSTLLISCSLVFALAPTANATFINGIVDLNDVYDAGA